MRTAALLGWSNTLYTLTLSISISFALFISHSYLCIALFFPSFFSGSWCLSVCLSFILSHCLYRLSLSLSLCPPLFLTFSTSHSLLSAHSLSIFCLPVIPCCLSIFLSFILLYLLIIAYFIFLSYYPFFLSYTNAMNSSSNLYVLG